MSHSLAAPARTAAARPGGHSLSLLLLLLCLALAPPAQAGEAVPQRIVSVGGSVTEILYALDLGGRVIATDTTSIYPAAAEELPKVGYMRALAAEPLVALKPDLILAEADAGPPAVLRQVKEAGLPLVLMPDDPTPEGVVAKVRAVAKASGKESEGEALAAALAARFEDLRQERAKMREQPRVLFLLSHSGGTMAAGDDTSAASIVALAGGRNALAGAFSGYKPLSPEAAVTAAPDVVLLTNQGLEAIGGRPGLAADPALGLTSAVQEERIVAMDALLLLGFGPRTPEAAAALMQNLRALQ